jgi:hypothetical protein
MSKNSLNKTLVILGVNMLVGLITGGVLALPERNDLQKDLKTELTDPTLVLNCTLIGLSSGMKYSFISGISNAFAGDYANYGKIAGSLAVNIAAGAYIGCTGPDLSTGLPIGATFAAGLTIIDAINFGIESYIDYIDYQEAAEHIENN